MSTVYASSGEIVTCTNGHPICEFLETVHVGDTQDVRKQLGNWRQREPAIGESGPHKCSECGALWLAGGTVFHIGNEWRDPFGLIAKYGIE